MTSARCEVRCEWYIAIFGQNNRIFECKVRSTIKARHFVKCATLSVHVNKKYKRIINFLSEKRSNKKDKTTKNTFEFRLIFSLSSMSASQPIETTIVTSLRSTVLNLFTETVKDQYLVNYQYFLACFYSTESRRDWLLPIIILSAGSVAVLVMLFIRFIVKKKWTSSYHIKKREFSSPLGDQWVVVHWLVKETRKLSMRTLQAKNIKHDCA